MAAYDRPIIIKKVKKHAHVHHGGAWKIAYADFVTAMMAFFLLLWLISMTTDEQKKGLADYFAPPNVSETTSGAGGVMAGTAIDSNGAKQTVDAIDSKTVVLATNPTHESGEPALATGPRPMLKDGTYDASKASQEDLSSLSDQEFLGAAASIKQAWAAQADLTEVAQNLMVEVTEESLDIVISDQSGEPMFPDGSKYPFEATRKAIAAIAPILERLPNPVRISGHVAAGGSYTDPTYGPWELSADRADVVRALLGEFGLSDDHIEAVIGRAASEPFLPDEPYMDANERVEIVLLRRAPPVPPDLRP